MSRSYDDYVVSRQLYRSLRKPQVGGAGVSKIDDDHYSAKKEMPWTMTKSDGSRKARI